MRRLRRATLPVVTAVLLTACGTDPSPGVAVPGAPAAATTVARPTTTAPDTTVPPPATTTAPASTTAPTTTTAPPPTSTSAPTTTEAAPATTDASATTTPGPTTTALVYVAESPSGTLRYGMEGPRTRQLQQDLIQLGYLPPGADDGQYGPGTAGGVRRFQEAAGLIVDGVAGPVTQDALAQAIADAAAPPADE